MIVNELSCDLHDANSAQTVDHPKKAPVVVRFEFAEAIGGSTNLVPCQGPLLQLLVENRTEQDLKNLVVEFHTDTGFARARSWTIASLPASPKILAIKDLEIEIVRQYSDDVENVEFRTVAFRVAQEGTVLHESTCIVRVLPRNYWAGVEHTPEAIACYVCPNDSSLSVIEGKAKQILSDFSGTDSWNGYQSDDTKQVVYQIAAIWNAISTQNFSGGTSSDKFSISGQSVRFAQQIAKDQTASPLDLSLLYASLLESAGLNPLLVFHQNHCLVGCWTKNKPDSNLVESNATNIRKAIDAGELIVLDCTAACDGRQTFEDAISRAHVLMGESNDNQFQIAVDIKQARVQRIRPLIEDANAAIAEAPILAPNFDALSLPESSPETTEVKPKTARGRMDRWKNQLLDTSAKNPLLNYRSNSKSSIPFLYADIPLLEDLLAQGKQLKIIPAPTQSAPEKSSTTQSVELVQYQNKFAAEALSTRGEIVANLTAEELAKRLKTVERNAKSLMSESGANMLFLAIGFLRWSKPGEKKKTSYRAPLVLVPVKLTKETASAPFILSQHEDEAQFNSTLSKMLQDNFDCNFNDLDIELPKDDHGVDVAKVMQLVRARTRGIEGVEVMEELGLTTFSFAKFLMWKDLAERESKMLENPIIKRLLDTGSTQPDTAGVTGSTGVIRDQQLDQNFDQGNLLHPLPADSSQLAAVVTAAAGKSFVLQGPPGTGKSQTIANMIAQCLAEKKTVLFVAEKTAALDVVQRRLHQHGLGKCCLELHSKKSERRNFLEQMESSWNREAQGDGGQWTETNLKLQGRRDELNSYVEALHRQAANGLTPYQAMGMTAQETPDAQTFELGWPAELADSKDHLQLARETVQDAALAATDLKPNPVMYFIGQVEWSNIWQSNLMETCQQLHKVSTNLDLIASHVYSTVGLTGRELQGPSDLAGLDNFMEAIKLRTPNQWNALFCSLEQITEDQILTLKGQLERWHDLVSQLSATYETSILSQIPVADLDLEYRKAQAATWPLSKMKKAACRKMLQTYAKEGSADPARDLVLIQSLQKLFFQIKDSPAAKTDVFGLGLDVKIDQLVDGKRALLFMKDQINVAFGEIPPQSIAAITNEASVTDWQELSLVYRQQLEQFRLLISTFNELSNANSLSTINGAPWLKNLCQALEEFQNLAKAWKSWCSWHKLRQKCDDVGVKSLMDKVTSGELHPCNAIEAFERAYAKWWLPLAIDGSPILRAFERYRHENAIVDFQELDERARVVAGAEINRRSIESMPSPTDASSASDVDVLRRQLSAKSKKTGKSIRQIIESMPNSFSKIVPCVMMSPLSIAQYLPGNLPLFDVIIFDEASQVPTWDAIGAISRGKQLVVVGDPKQLPPTNFFGKQADDDQDQEVIEQESILDEVMAAGVTTISLKWHYRSRAESLIAFSNKHYYDNELLTFPESGNEANGTTFHHLPEAIYDRGGSRRNKIEAQAVVADAVSMMQEQLRINEGERKTFGVVTFNQAQQTLIQDLLDSARQENPEIEWFFSDERIEPTIVKNLESIQGDERDIIMFSVTFGFDKAGTMSRNFGALNNVGGERRLNVAITRAKFDLRVYSSFKADQLKSRGLTSRGVIDFKHFLDFAERGEEALARECIDSVGGYDSPFEKAVADSLSKLGWQMVTQVGVSGFRIDLGVVDPDLPGAYLAGVECDGATYHSSATARDRDKTRQQVLEGLGWNILRIWSTDWWHDSQEVIERIDNQLKELLTKRRTIIGGDPSNTLEQNGNLNSSESEK